MGGTLGPDIGSGIMRGRMQNNPMPPGQMGPPNPFGMIPEFKFDPEKGLNVTLSPEHIQQIISGIGLVRQPGQQPVGQPPIIPQQGQLPQMQQMGALPDPNMYRRPI